MKTSRMKQIGWGSMLLLVINQLYAKTPQPHAELLLHTTVHDSLIVKTDVTKQLTVQLQKKLNLLLKPTWKNMLNCLKKSGKTTATHFIRLKRYW